MKNPGRNNMVRAQRVAGEEKKERRKNRKERPATAKSGITAHEDLRYRSPLFPPRFRKVLSYAEHSLSVTSTAGIVGNYFFTANGCFDPNVTGTGHQPMGFDQMMSMYEQYTVVASRITVHFTNLAPNLYATCAIYLSPDTTSITDRIELIENGLMVWKPLQGIGTFGSQATLNLDCDIATYFGRNLDKRALLDDVNLFGTAAANPTEQVYFAVACMDLTGNNNMNLTFVVEIQYEVIFWEPKKLASS